MNQQNGSASFPPTATARGVAHLLSRSAALLDLQLELLKVDTRDVVRSLILPAILVVSGVSFALGAVFVLLLSLAAVLSYAAGLPVAAALLIASLVGVALAAALVVAAIRILQHSRVPYGRSIEEVRNSLRWVQRAGSQDSYR